MVNMKTAKHILLAVCLAAVAFIADARPHFNPADTVPLYSRQNKSASYNIGTAIRTAQGFDVTLRRNAYAVAADGIEYELSDDYEWVQLSFKTDQGTKTAYSPVKYLNVEYYELPPRRDDDGTARYEVIPWFDAEIYYDSVSSSGLIKWSVVKVQRIYDDGWALCEYDGKIGQVKMEYLKPTERSYFKIVHDREIFGRGHVADSCLGCHSEVAKTRPEKKQALIEQAEALKDSTEWKKTTDQYISLQKQWREIGPVPRKKSEQLWKRFRAACDEFFARRDANASPENDFYGNLKAKRKLIEEIRAFVAGDDETANAEMMREFNERWQAIGHVPYKEKDSILAEFREVMQEKFPLFSRQRSGRQGASSNQHRSPKDLLIAKYNTLQQNIATYENNIGFFSSSSSGNPLIQQMQAKIDEAKAELKKLEEQIRNAEEESK